MDKILSGCFTRIAVSATLIFHLFSVFISGQYPFDIPRYPFIQYNQDSLDFVSVSPAFIRLFEKFDSLIKTGNTSIRIVHIGGSHIQADIYTHRMRQQLQTFYPGINGSRGFIFPYKIAKTNNPSNYSVKYTGNWTACKNTQFPQPYQLGLSGITAILNDTAAYIQIVAHFDSIHNYDFNRVRIFCNSTQNDYAVSILPQSGEDSIKVARTEDYIQFNLNNYIDTLKLSIHKNDSTNKFFELYGISLDNDDAGVTYNSIGVNGAMLRSYLECGLFTRHLNDIDPDLVIISVGTNDGNTRHFDGEKYQNEYLQLLERIKAAAPDAAILLTVPNDSYLFKRYVNQNTNQMRLIILDIAKQHGYGVWDFYTVMGGLNSAADWYAKGLMSSDHIHFNKKGYLLIGDLFFDAFMTSWNKHLDP